MDDKKFNDVLEEDYQKYEFITLIVLTTILVGAWLLSSDMATRILGTKITSQLKLYLHGSVIVAIIITAITMRIVGWKLIACIIKLIRKIKGVEE